LTATGFLCACIYGFNRRDKVRELVAYLSKNARDFYAEHVEKPAREIIDELVFNHRTRITDVEALKDSHESLRRMLAEFMRDTMKNMPKEEIERRSAALDMTVVSGRFESEVSSAVWNLAVGEITRIMLIQVAFIKKELLVAMSAIEDLMDGESNIMIHSPQSNTASTSTVTKIVISFFVSINVYKYPIYMYAQQPTISTSV
jgi:nuclear control of ATPase protein 2